MISKKYISIGIIRCVMLLWPLLIFHNLAKADHLNGADISYRGLDSFRYEVTFKIYRDCAGVSLTYLTDWFRITCVTGGASDTLKPTLKSIRDLTPVCGSATKPCNPNNTKGTGEGTEEHVYCDTIDFKSAKYKTLFAGCCQFSISISGCCRSSDISTGSANKTFYNYAMLDICKAPGNSSPNWTTNAFYNLCVNQPIYYNPGASDTVDFDSLSYTLGYPLCGTTCYTPYASDPLTTYDPTGKGITNPNANPPIGLYFDPKTGDFICTPSKTGEISPVVFEVKEWRKDANGKYQLIGITRKDAIFKIISCNGNNSPLIDGPYSYNICANQTICFNVTTDDKVKVPPSGPTPAPDTVRISWNKGIPDGSFTIANKQALHQTGRFCWTPNDSHARSLPYHFVVSALDNNCPVNTLSSRSFGVLVKPNAKATITKAKLSCNQYQVNAVPISTQTKPSSHQWLILNAKGQPIIDKKTAPFFKTGSTVSTKSTDTIQFRRSGTYILKLSLNNKSNCPLTSYDTLVVDSVFEARISTKSDTTICDGETLKTAISFTFGKPSFQYKWNTGDTSSQLNYALPKNVNLFQLHLDVMDSVGCVAFDDLTVMRRDNPKVVLPKDETICELDSVILQPKTWLAVWDDPRTTDTTFVTQGKYFTYSWTLEGAKISTDSILKATVEGKYVLTIVDSAGCSNQDDFNLKINEVAIVPSIDTAFCNGTSINMIPPYYDTISQGKSGVYSWWDISNANDIKYLGQFLKSYLLTQSTRFKLAVTLVEDGLSCTKYDTVQYRTNPLPIIKMPNDTNMCCNSLRLDLLTFLEGGSWSTENKNVLVDGRYFQPNVSCDGDELIFTIKYKLVDSITACASKDSFIITTRKLPQSKLNDKAFCGSLDVINPVSRHVTQDSLNWSDFQYEWSCLGCSEQIWSKLFSDKGNAPLFNIGKSTVNLLENQYDSFSLQLFLKNQYGCEQKDTAILTILGDPKINRDMFSGNAPFQACSDQNVVLQTHTYPSKWSLFRGGNIEHNLLRSDTITPGSDVLILNAGEGCTADSVFVDFHNFEFIHLLNSDTSLRSIRDHSVLLETKSNTFKNILWHTSSGASFENSTGKTNVLFLPQNKTQKRINIPVWVVFGSANFCASNSDTMLISLRPDPCTVFEISGNRNQITCTPADLTQDQYIWKLSNGKTSTEQIPTFTLTDKDSSVLVSLTTVSALNDSCIISSYVNFKTLGIHVINGVKISPNPVTTYLYVKGLETQNARYDLVSTTGQIIEQGVLMNGEIDCSFLANGIYYVSLRFNGNVFYQKFVFER